MLPRLPGSKIYQQPQGIARYAAIYCEYGLTMVVSERRAIARQEVSAEELGRKRIAAEIYGPP
jgi:fructose-1,6-bisphosphatase